MTTISFDPTALGAEVGAFKAACVRAENASTPFARKALAGLLTGGATVSSVSALLLAAFKPKRPNGKAADKLSQLRYAVGGDAARKAAEKVFSVYENASLNDDIKAAIVAFVLESAGGAKSLNALVAEVAALVKQHNEATNAEEAAEGADDTTAEENGTAETPPVEAAPADLADMVNRMIVAIDSAEVAALAAVQDRLAALMTAIEVASARIEETAELRTGTEG